LIILLTLSSLVVLGLAGYGAATGRLGKDNITQYLATWRGEKLVPPTPEVVEEEPEETPQQASDRIAAARIQSEITNREIERDIETLRAMQTTVAEARGKMEKDLVKLQKEKNVFDTRLNEYNLAIRDEGFKKSLKNYSQMKAKMVKEDFMKMGDEEVVHYLANMKTDVATKIFEQFKTPTEQAKRLRLMKLMQEYQEIKVSSNDQSNTVSSK